MISFLLNAQSIQTALPPGTTVLDFIRNHRHLTGTKIGCREGDCGACTVLVGELQNGQVRYQTMTSCLMPLANAHGKHVVTVEGLNLEKLSPVQAAIVEEGASQCGFCTPGFVVSLTGFLMQDSDFQPLETLEKQAVEAMDGNICRCTGYKSLEKAGEKLAELAAQRNGENPVAWLVKNEALPVWFLEVAEQLKALKLGGNLKLPPNFNGNGNGKIIGGGTDLLVQKPEEILASPLENVFDRSDWKGIFEENGNVHVGATATATDFFDSPIAQHIFPRLDDFKKLVSSTPIRNMATVGGNFVNASPIGDLTIFFLALDATLVLNLGGVRREVPLRQFFKGYKKLDLQAGEQVERLFFKGINHGDFKNLHDLSSHSYLPHGGKSAHHFNFEKVSKRTHLDIASVNSACLLKMEGEKIVEAHLSAGGVSPIPLYLKNASAALIGKEISAGLLREVNEIMQAEISPISDARGSAVYKRLLLRQLLFAHFLTFLPEMKLSKLAKQRS